MKLLVIDGNSIINRAFYGIKLLTTADGVFTNGVYGFINILNREIEEENPDVVISAFDMRAPTFRHKKYAEYKAQRKGMPDELAAQLPVLKEVLCAMGVLCLEKEGFEADDIIGTISAMCEKSGDDCIIITGDRDDLQLVGPHTTCKLTVTKGGRNECTVFTPEAFTSAYGFTPEKMVDLKALWGDSSDNIPGVAGIGEKSATELVQKFGTVQYIYDHIDELDIKESVRNKLKADRDRAFLSYDLATIFKEVPLGFSLESLEVQPADYTELLRLYTRLEFRAFAAKVRSKIADDKTPLQSVEAVEFETVEETSGLSKILTGAEKAFILNSDEGVYFNCKNQVYFIPRLAFGTVAALLESPVKKSAHDIKSLLTDYACNADFSTFEFDTMLAAYLINPAASTYSAETLVSDYLSALSTTSASACAQMPKIENALRERISALSMDFLYFEIELPLCFVLFEMEQKGVKLDVQKLSAFGADLRRRIAQCTEDIYSFAGEEFNINSTKQLGSILFDKLMLPHGKKNKNGAYKTDAETLDKLSGYPIVKAILAYRQYSKLLSTYVEGLLAVVNAEDSRVHTTFNQTVTVTGRISSTEPNLQNIPVRTELGRDMRKMFVAKDGCVLLDADYSQIELRVLAAMADDENMKNAFINGEDIHTATASQVFGVPASMVTPEMRRNAKAVNFGIVYGISAFSLANDIGTSLKDAKDYIEAYFLTYGNIKTFLDKTVSDAKEKGYVSTLFGRRRALPELSASNHALRAFGERAAMNAPIQGTAADIIKLAMVRVQARLKRENLKARLVLQIHDELIIEAPESEKDRAAEILQEEMENVYALSVPLKADVGAGKSWYDAK